MHSPSNCFRFKPARTFAVTMINPTSSTPCCSPAGPMPRMSQFNATNLLFLHSSFLFLLLMVAQSLVSSAPQTSHLCVFKSQDEILDIIDPMLPAFLQTYSNYLLTPPMLYGKGTRPTVVMLSYAAGPSPDIRAG